MSTAQTPSDLRAAREQLTREINAEHLDEASFLYLQRCAICSLYGLCEQCPAKSWAEHGNLDTPVEYACQVAHAQARYLGLLGDGETAWEAEDGPRRVARLREEKWT